MVHTPKVGGTPPLPEQQPAGTQPAKASPVEASVEQAAKDALKPVPETGKESKGWGLFSWFGWGKKAEGEEASDIVEKEITERDDDTGALLGESEDDFLGASDIDARGKEELAEDAASALLTEPTEDKVSALEEFIIPEVKVPVVEKTPVSDKKVEFEKTATKTQQVGKWWWQRLTAAAGDKLANFATQKIQSYAGSYAQAIDSVNSVAQAKQTMLEHLDDPRYIELFDMVFTLATSQVESKIEGLEDGFVARNLKAQPQLVIDLIKVNLAKGFANLARQTHEQREAIPNYDSQPTLVSVISLISQKAGKHMSAAQLSQIEEKYRKNRIELKTLTMKFFPDLEAEQQKKDNDVEQLKNKVAILKKDKTEAAELAKAELALKALLAKPTRKELIKKLIETDNLLERSEIEIELFPDINTADLDRTEEIGQFTSTCIMMHRRHLELKGIFSLLADDVLSFLFPKRFMDMEIPGFLKWGDGTVAESIYSWFVKDALVGFLQETYEPMENDATRNDGWKKDLQDRLGAPDLAPIIAAPSAFGLAFIKDFIQSNPKAVTFTAMGVNSLVHPTKGSDNFQLFVLLSGREPTLAEEQALDKELSQILAQKKLAAKPNQSVSISHEEFVEAYAKIAKIQLLVSEKQVLIANLEKNQKENLFAQLSHYQLANWFVESVQAMLHSEDSHLLGLGHFVNQGLNNLTLALLAKGAKLAIPEGDKVEKNQFIKELTDRIVAKFSAYKGDEVIPDQFWKDFVNDLPLPAPVKSILTPLVIEKAKSLQAQLKDKTDDFKEIEKLYTDTEAKVRNFKRGEELLSISDKISKQVIDQLLEKNIGLISAVGLGDTFEELLTQYLPGVKIDEDLKAWFKENLSSLGVSAKGVPPKSIEIFKRGIQAVVLAAIVNTIETNFKNNSEDYAAQLLQNIHQAFIKSLKGFDEDQREELERAFIIQDKIQEAKDKIDALGKELADKPKGLNPVQTALLEEALEANMRTIRAGDYIFSLQSDLEDALEALNKLYLKRIGSPDDGAAWTSEELPLIGNALVLYKIRASSYPSLDAFKKTLEKEIQEAEALVDSPDVQKAQEARDAIDVRDFLIDLLEMPSEELKLISNAVHINATIQHAEQEQAKLKGELDEKLKAVEEHELEKMSNRPDWEKAVEWMKAILPSREKLHLLTKEVADLNKELDSHLKIFQVLSHELTALLGLDQKDKLKLPAFLQDTVWPLIESARNEHIARLLFEQLTPMILVITDVQKNKDRLTELSKGDQFLVQLAASASAEVVEHISDFVTNYRPFAEQILITLGVDNPTDDEIDRMEGSLRLVMIDAGREGVTASMLKHLLKGIVPQDKEEAISIALAEWIEIEEETELSGDHVLQILKKEIGPQINDQDEHWKKEAKFLAHTVNEFLINHGKGKLTAQDLLDAYQEQVEGRQKEIPADKMKGALHDLAAAKLVEKIKTVVVTHEEIAQALNEIIPGAKDLHTLIAPQLEAVITGQDAALKANRKFVQDYIEGMLLQLFVKIGEANFDKDQGILTVLANKLESIVSSAEDLKGKTPEEVARQMIDQVLAEVLGIASPNDLDGIPIVLRKVGYAKMKEQAYQQLTPLLLPMIELNLNREKLHDLSGSKFLGNLGKALSKDMFFLLPSVVSSYRATGIELFVLLSGRQPSADEADQFAKEIIQIVKLDKQMAVTNEMLAEAYAKVAKLTINKDERQDLTDKLEDRHALNDILNVIITPEEMTAAIGEAMPTVDPKLLQAFAGEIQDLIHNNPQAYQHFSGFAEVYLEGMLVKILMRVAEKNPTQKGKDTLIILTEKLLVAATKKFEEAKTRPPQEVAQEFNDLVLQELLGIDSPKAFEGLPDPLQETVYKLIKDQLGGFLLRIQQGLATLDSSEDAIKAAQKGVKKFGVANAAGTGYAQILAEDLANMIVSTVPDVLTEMGSQNMVGVNVISKGVESYLEELARGNLEMASVLLNYTKGVQFQKMLGGLLENLALEDEHVEDKKKSADLIANLMLVPLNGLLGKAIQFEDKQGEAFNQKLMANVLHVAANHFKILNEAKVLAALEGRTTILHKDFVAAAGKGLHPAVPVEQVTFKETIEAIGSKIYSHLPADQLKKWKAERAKLRTKLVRLAKDDSSGKKVLFLSDLIREMEAINVRITGGPLKPWQLKELRAKDKNGLTLRDLIRQEASAPAEQRLQEAYTPAIKTVMEMIFPNGKKDLTFVPEELRGQVWKLFEAKLFPVVLPMITELLLDPDVINSMILSSLETMRDELRGPIVLGPKEPADLPLDALDQASGELIGEMLHIVKLPDWIKNLITDPKTGEVSPDMQKALGATLRKQFNRRFIRDKLELALEKVVERDEKGNYLLKPDLASKEEKIEKAAEKREAIQKDFKRVSREVVDVSISYFIRSKWAEAQVRFDELVARAFGKIGVKLKQALDTVFGFIFFKIIGTILEVLFYPIKGLIKEKIYDIISLDENREILLSLLTKAPVDQPLTEGHVVHLEDLVYHIGEAIKQTVDESLNEPVLPMPDDKFHALTAAEGG